MGFIGRPYKARSHKPDEGLDGAGLVVLGLKRVGLFAGDDVWPDGPSLAEVAARLTAAGITLAEHPEAGWWLEDPSHNRIHLTTGPGAN